MKKSRGFTIVELLIVIVVIAILAAVTVVAYNGLQQRARNTAVETAARNYYNAITAYVAQNGTMPLVSNSACMGEQADYANNCFNGPGTFNTTLGTNIKTILSKLPSLENRCYEGWHPGNPSQCRYNMTYYHNTAWLIDGVSHPYYMIYFLNGNQKCGQRSLEGSYGNFATMSSRGYMEQRGGDTMCIIRIPTP